MNGKCREEVGNFHSSRGRSIRTVNGVGIDRRCKVRANRARVSLLRVGCAHELTILGDGIFAFEHLNHHRARGHEFNEVGEEGALAVHGIKAFGFALG